MGYLPPNPPPPGRHVQHMQTRFADAREQCRCLFTIYFTMLTSFLWKARYHAPIQSAYTTPDDINEANTGLPCMIFSVVFSWSMDYPANSFSSEISQDKLLLFSDRTRCFSSWLVRASGRR